MISEAFFCAIMKKVTTCLMLYSQVMMDKIEVAIKEGMVGEDSEW